MANQLGSEGCCFKIVWKHCESFAMHDGMLGENLWFHDNFDEP